MSPKLLMSFIIPTLVLGALVVVEVNCTTCDGTGQPKQTISSENLQVLNINAVFDIAPGGCASTIYKGTVEVLVANNSSSLVRGLLRVVIMDEDSGEVIIVQPLFVEVPPNTKRSFSTGKITAYSHLVYEIARQFNSVDVSAGVPEGGCCPTCNGSGRISLLKLLQSTQV